jgi:HEPN domain-containing protein
MVRRALEPPRLREAAVYHAQQAAEKSLKGLLTLHGQPFTRTHVLEPLIEACRSIEPAFIVVRHLVVGPRPDGVVTGPRY